MRLLIAVDKSRFHNIRQLAEELTRYGIIYKLIDDLDIYDKPGIFDKYIRWLKTPKKFFRSAGKLRRGGNSVLTLLMFLYKFVHSIVFIKTHFD